MMDVNDSEYSYEILISKTQLNYRVIQFLFSLKWLYVEALFNLILYIIESYEWNFDGNLKSLPPVRWVLLICNVMVVLSFASLICIYIYKRLHPNSIYRGTECIKFMIVLEFCCLASVIMEIIGNPNRNLIFYIFKMIFITWRTLKVIRFYRYSGSQDNAAKTFVLVAKFLLIYTFYFHSAICIWRISCPNCEKFPNGTFMGTDEFKDIISSLSENSDQGRTPFEMYLFCFYYIMGATTHTGAGNPAAGNVTEQALMVVIMYISIILNFLFICEMCFLKHQKFINQYRYSNQLLLARKQLDHARIPRSVKRKMMDYYVSFWEKERALNLDEMLSVLPKGLRSDLILDRYWFAINQTNLFHDESKFFKRSVANSMNTEYYGIGDVVISPGHLVMKIYFVSRGNLDVLSEEDDESPVLSFGVGACFGDLSMVYSCYSRFTIVTKTNCTLHTLHKGDFWRIAFLRQISTRNMHEKLQTRLMIGVRRHFKGSTLQTNKSVKTLWRVKDHLPKENQLRIYDVRNTYKKTPFLRPYESYVMSTIPATVTSDSICYRTLWPWTLQENSAFVVSWQLFMLLTICFMVYYLPYNIFVRRQFKNWMFRLVCNYFTLIFLLDVIIQISRVTESEHSSVTKFWDIAQVRLSSWTFLVDLTAAIPFRLLLLVGNLDEVYSIVAHCVPLIKATQLPIYFNIITSRYIFLKQKYFELLMHMFLVLSFSYWGSCASYMAKCYSNSTICNSDSGLRAIRDRAIEDLGLEQGDRLYGKYKFLVSFYVNAMAVTQNAVTQLFNVREMCLTMLMSFCGLILQGFFMGQFSSTLMLSREFLRNYEMTCNQFMLFMHMKNFNKQMRSRIVTYLETQWWFNMCTPQSQLMRDLPKSLYVEWKCNFYKPVLMGCPLFQMISEQILNSVAEHCDSMLLPPGEILAYGGTQNEDVFIIDEGYAELIYANSGTVHRIITSGNSMCVLEVLLGKKTLYTIRALTYLRVVKIRIYDLMFAFSQVPAFKNQLEEAVLQTTQKVRQVFLAEQYLNIDITHTNQIVWTQKKSMRRSWNVFPRRRSDPRFREWRDQFKDRAFYWFLRTILLRRSINPDGDFAFYWELVRSLIVWTFCIIDPLEYYFWNHFMTLELVIFLCVAFWLTIDMYIQMHVCYYDLNNILIVHPRFTACHYLRGRFIVDILGMIPYNLLACGIRTSTQVKWSLSLRNMLSMAKYLLLIRTRCLLYRFQKFKLMQRVVYCFFAIWAICNFLTNILIVLSIEWGWYNWYQSSDLIPKAYCWLLETKVYNTTKRLSFDFYMKALRFVAFNNLVMGLETITYILDPKERIFTICNCIFGYFFYALLTIIVASHYNVTSYSDKFERYMGRLRNYLKWKKVTKEVRGVMLKHMENVWRKTQGVDMGVVEVLDDSLRQDFTMFLYGNAIKHAVGIRHDVSFQRVLSVNVKELHYLENFCIYRVNDILESLYVVYKGEVQILAADGSPLGVLGEGSMLGNFDKVQMCRSMVSAMTVTETTLLEIGSEKFYAINAIDPRVFGDIHEYIRCVNVSFIANNRRRKPKFNMKRKHVFFQRAQNCFTSQIGHALYVGLSFVTYLLVLHLIEFNKFYIKVLLIILDLLTCLKVFLQLFTSKRRFRSILRRSLKRPNLIFDFLSVIPLEALSLTISDTKRSKYYRYLHLNRILRTYTMFEYFHFVTIRKNRGLMTINILSIAVYGIMLIRTGHCLFHTLVCDMEQCTSGNWMVHDGHDLCSANRYICSLFMTTTMITFRGHTHFIPVEVSEILIAIVFTIVCRFLFAVLIGCSVSVMEHLRYGLIEYDHNSDKLHRAVKNAKVSRALYDKIRVYTHKVWMKCRGVHVPRFLIDAPKTLANEIKYQAYGRLIFDNPLFMSCHRDFLRQLVGCLKVRYYFRDDIICHEGDIDETMYFINRGKVDVCDSNGHCRTLYSGDCFGLVQGLFSLARHMYTYRCCEVSEMVMLKLNDWKHLLHFFPSARFWIYENVRDPTIFEGRLCTWEDDLHFGNQV